MTTEDAVSGDCTDRIPILGFRFQISIGEPCAENVMADTMVDSVSGVISGITPWRRSPVDVVGETGDLSPIHVNPN